MPQLLNLQRQLNIGTIVTSEENMTEWLCFSNYSLLATLQCAIIFNTKSKWKNGKKVVLEGVSVLDYF